MSIIMDEFIWSMKGKSREEKRITIQRYLRYINSYKEPELPLCPTNYLPGTEGKIQEMIWRRENGFHIHHPDDAKNKH